MRIVKSYHGLCELTGCGQARQKTVTLPHSISAAHCSYTQLIFSMSQLACSTRMRCSKKYRVKWLSLWTALHSTESPTRRSVVSWATRTLSLIVSPRSMNVTVMCARANTLCSWKLLESAPGVLKVRMKPSWFRWIQGYTDLWISDINFSQFFSSFFTHPRYYKVVSRFFPPIFFDYPVPDFFHINSIDFFYHP